MVEINSHRVYNVRRWHSEAETRVAVITFRANRDNVIELFLLLFVCLKVKDLKRQLKLERKRAEQLQQKLQDALSENRVKPGMFFFSFFKESLFCCTKLE